MQKGLKEYSTLEIDDIDIIPLEELVSKVDHSLKSNSLFFLLIK